MSWVRSLEKKYFLSSKIVYFSISVLYYVVHQVRSLFAIEQFGATKQELGYYFGFFFFISFFTNIFIATAADRFQNHKKIVLLMIIMSFISFQSFFIEEVKRSGQIYFWAVMCFYLIFNSAIPPLLDTILLAKCGAFYGRQRIFDSFGYIFSSVIVETIISKKEGKYHFEKVRYFHVGAAIITFVLCLLLLQNLSSKKNEKWRLSLLSSQPLSYFFFLVIILLNGIVRGAMTKYLSIFYTEVLNLEDKCRQLPYYLGFMRKRPISTCTIAGTLGEMVIFLFSNKIIETLGLWWPLLLGMFAQLLRFICYLSMDWNSSKAFIFSVVIELLKGLCFGLIHIPGCQISMKMCPDDLKATSQVLYNGVYVALGSLCSGVIFGNLFEGTNAVREFKNFYICNICITLLSIVLFMLSYKILEKKCKMICL